MRDVRDAVLIGRDTKGAVIRRPISPFMIPTAYRPQLTSVLSISNRLAGIALCAGTALAVWWLLALAVGAGAFATVRAVTLSPIGLILVALWVLALVYHTLGGIRHLVWDAGHGFDLPMVHRTGWAVIIATIVLTALLWVVGAWLLA